MLFTSRSIIVSRLFEKLSNVSSGSPAIRSEFTVSKLKVLADLNALNVSSVECFRPMELRTLSLRV